MAVATVRWTNIGTPAYIRRLTNSAGYDKAKAYLAQVSTDADLVYRFPYAPVEVNYESLSSEYEEIKRPNDYSFITRRGPQLARLTFEFRVADRLSRGYSSIVPDLELLRGMALADVPVVLVGMGDFLFGADQNSQAIRSGTRNQSLYRIMEMGITIVQRSAGTNEPTQADCRVTLIEDRNPVFNVVQLPTIVYEEEPPAQVASTKTGGNGGKSKKKNSTPAPTQNNTAGRNYTKTPPQPRDDRRVLSGGSQLV